MSTKCPVRVNLRSRSPSQTCPLLPQLQKSGTSLAVAEHPSRLGAPRRAPQDDGSLFGAVDPKHRLGSSTSTGPRHDLAGAGRARRCGAGGTAVLAARLPCRADEAAAALADDPGG